MERVLIGTVTLKKDTVMYNQQFSYAADFEELTVKAGKYPIYAYLCDLLKVPDGIALGWRNYVGYEGEVIRNSFGSKPGTPTSFHRMAYPHHLAECFMRSSIVDDKEYELAPDWEVTLREGEYDGRRIWSHEIRLKAGAELPIME